MTDTISTGYGQVLHWARIMTEQPLLTAIAWGGGSAAERSRAERRAGLLVLTSGKVTNLSGTGCAGQSSEQPLRAGLAQRRWSRWYSWACKGCEPGEEISDLLGCIYSDLLGSR